MAVEYLTLDGVFEDPSWSQPYFDESVAAYQGGLGSRGDSVRR